MPVRGSATRAEQRATISRISHQKFTSPEVGKLLDGLRSWGEQQDYDSLEASLIRVAARDWDKARRVPAELRADMSRAASLGQQVWVEARKNNDFAAFIPALRENLDLRKRYVECFDDYDEPYDVLLDDYEPRDEDGRRPAPLRLPEGASGAARQGGRRARRDPERPPARASRSTLQNQFELEVLRQFGFSDDAWRLDPTVHPFATGTGINDIRVTTRYFPDNLDGLFATMHEFGHGLYEHQVDEALERTPLARGVSLGMHESQSRMWENLVGRSLPFWRGFFPRLQSHVPRRAGRLRRRVAGTAR